MKWQKTEIIAQLSSPSPSLPTFNISGVPLKVVPHFTTLGASLSPKSTLCQ